ncbi:MAG TPA: class I tRNA ligase family protein, partial [Bacteroidia bacterium]
TGIVRDKLGRKMSKSLGNSPDPIELMQKYGADGVRVGMLLCSPAGNDLPFDESYCEQGRNFSNKIWNAFRLIKGWNLTPNPSPTGEGGQPQGNKIAVDWFEAKFNNQLEYINDLYSKYRISEALMATYKLVWDDFCAWYLEMVKPEFVDGKSLPIDKATHDATIRFFEKLLQVLHPFMPFITEELWHLIRDRKEKDCILISEWPKEKKYNEEIIFKFDTTRNIIQMVKTYRHTHNVSPKEKILLFIKTSRELYNEFHNDIIIKIANLDKIDYIDRKIENAFYQVLTVTDTYSNSESNVGEIQIKQFDFFIPLPVHSRSEEKEKLSKELEYNQGFLVSVQKKLANERFVQNAKPEVIELEKKKQADAEAKIKAIQEQLESLK